MQRLRLNKAMGAIKQLDGGRGLACKHSGYISVRSKVMSELEKLEPRWGAEDKTNGKWKSVDYLCIDVA
jgi:hypothetical protein